MHNFCKKKLYVFEVTCAVLSPPLTLYNFTNDGVSVDFVCSALNLSHSDSVQLFMLLYCID
jgi:hypothetical protein